MEEELGTEAVETAEPAAEAVEKPKRGARVKAVLREHFSAPRIAYMAFFTALAFVVTFLEFPIFPAASFLKFDFANLFFMIEGFIFGPVEAIISIGIKELLCWTKSSTAGVGEIANFIMSTAYIIIPSVAYRFKRGKWWVCLYLACACVMQMSVSLVVNRYINYWFFCDVMHFIPNMNSGEFFAVTWQFVLGFNAIKSVGISIVVFLVYKPLSRFIKMTTEKFDRRMARAKEKRKSKNEQA